MATRKTTQDAVTIVDVAREAKVSLATAARVLRASPYPVSEKLAERVKATAERLGYVPNQLARTLRGRRGGSFGLIVGDMRDPYFGKIAAYVTAEAHHRSLLAVVANMQRDPTLEIAMARKLWEHRIDGLILAGGGFDQVSHLEELRAFVMKLQAAGVVVVSLSERNLPIPHFSGDNEAIGRALANALLERGHRQIGVAAGPRGGFVAEGRIRGLRSVLEPLGLKAEVVHSDYTQDGAVAASDALVRGQPSLTAIVALSDALGLGIIKRLQQTGVLVPGQVSVLSVGDTEYCELGSPRLSSIDTSIEAYCGAAIQHLEDLWAGREPATPPPFPIRLVERDSLASAPAASAP